MIKSATALKAKVKNISKSDDKIAKAYIRIFFMERFMERVSLSKYRENFVLKGGMLVSSLLGIDMRSTMDIDTTVKALPLTQDDMKRIVEEICEIQLEDNVTFKVVSIETIMDDFDYPGVRVFLEGMLDRLKQPIKIDVSTDDAITPGAIEYGYQLLFEERKISICSYNTETMLAEKAQTILNRGIANTRMRDFYDLYELVPKTEFSWDVLSDAFAATCKKRGTEFTAEKIQLELEHIRESRELESFWSNFVKKNYFVEEQDYQDVSKSVCDTIRKIAKI